MHPLDLIKTRFQSKYSLIKVTMENLMLKTKYLNIRVHLKVFDKYTINKDLKAYTKDFISLSLAKPWQQGFSFGCTDNNI